MKFDGYVNTDFWNTTWLPRRAKRIHLFHGVAGKYGLDAPVKIAPETLEDGTEDGEAQR